MKYEDLYDDSNNIRDAEKVEADEQNEDLVPKKNVDEKEKEIYVFLPKGLIEEAHETPSVSQPQNKNTAKSTSILDEIYEIIPTVYTVAIALAGLISIIGFLSDFTMAGPFAFLTIVLCFFRYLFRYSERALLIVVIVASFFILIGFFGLATVNCSDSSDSTNYQSSTSSSGGYNTITLTPSNFENYFNISNSCTLYGTSASLSYTIRPKSTNYANNYYSSSTIEISMRVSFYATKNSNSPIKTDYISITLNKSTGYRRSSSKTFYFNTDYDTIYWAATVISCTGSISY